jgi:ribose 5-phosphate isomerase B
LKVFLASDHAGFELKEKVKQFLSENNYEVTDCGAITFDKDDDYPDFIAKAAQSISADPENSRGIIFGGSGQAEAMVANKFKNVRCALFYAAVAPVGEADVSGRKSSDPFEMIRLTREHNNSNMLSIGARFITGEQAKVAVKNWLDTPFTNEERHVRRINKIKDIEKI